MKYPVLILIAIITFSCDEPCPNVYAPVCTPDGTQYDNDCEARNAGVKNYISCFDDLVCTEEYLFTTNWL
jgi:hypothetical protein